MEWNEVRPVLAASYELLGEEGDRATPEAVNEKLGREPRDERTARALELLYKGGYIDGIMVDQSPAPIFIEATKEGLQETSGWPKPGAGGDQLDLLLRLLDERIAAPETPPEEKTRLQRVRDSLGDAGRDIVVGVLSNFVAKQTGASD